MCWWCCMRVLEKCLPRNDIVRELAPYLQHVHQEDGGFDDETRRGGEAWARTQSPRDFVAYTDEKNSATSSDSLRNNPNMYPLQSQRVSLDDGYQAPSAGCSSGNSMSSSTHKHGDVKAQACAKAPHLRVNSTDGPTIDLAKATNGPYKRRDECCSPSSNHTSTSSQQNQALSSSMDSMDTMTGTAMDSGCQSASQQIESFQPYRNRLQARSQNSSSTMGSQQGPRSSLPHLSRADVDSAGGSTQSLEVSGSECSGAATSLSKKTSVAKIKTDLGDLTPVRWEKVVIVQVSVQGFREMMSQAKELMEDAKLLYEHTVLSRLASEYGGQEILSHSRSGLFVIAFASEFHAAKWCLSLQLSLVYAAWNDKLLKQFDDMKEAYVTTSGKAKKKMLLYRGFRVRMVIHTADPDVTPEKSLSDAVKWTKTVSEYAHGGQIILSDNVWDRLKEQLVQLGNPVVEDQGCHAVLGEEVLLMLLLPRDLECRRFSSLKSPHQLSLGMRDAPSAQKPVTMVFTFIEGARPLVRCHAEELAERIKTLCMVARELLRKHNGYECQELQGDFMLAFFTPASSILWCGEFQLRIRQKFREWNLENESQELSFSMSMGIETGVPASVSPHKTSGRADYFGNIVNQTARIAKAAHGGQVLIGGDAWSAFSAAQAVGRSQLILKTDKLVDEPGTTIFQFKLHGYYGFKGISKPIGLVEAIPIDVQSPMLNLELLTLVRGHVPKAKRLDEAQLATQPKTTVPDVPAELMRLNHGGELPNNSIRETEFDLNLSWDDSIFVFEDIDEETYNEEGECEDEDGRGRGSSSAPMVCGSVALAMRNSNLNHSQLMQLLRTSTSEGSTPVSPHSSATAVARTEDMDRV